MKELLGSRKKIMAGLCAFLSLMLVCTLVSKGIYASKLPQVTVDKPKKMSINHEVKVTGNVKQSRELAVNVPSGLRVKEVMVIPGDRVSEGDPLFLLDTEYLDDQIREKELEQKKLQLQIAALEGNLELAGEKKDREMMRAGEDVVRSGQQADKGVDRAKEDENAAKSALAAHEADPVDITSESERDKKMREYKDWVKRVDEANERQSNASKRVAELEKKIELLKLDIESLQKQIGEAGGSVTSGGGGAPADGQPSGEGGGDKDGQPSGEGEGDKDSQPSGESEGDKGSQPSGESEGDKGSQPSGEGGGDKDSQPSGAAEKPADEKNEAKAPKTQEAADDAGQKQVGGSYFSAEKRSSLADLKAELADKEAQLLQAQKDLAAAREELSNAGAKVTKLQENSVARPDFTAEEAEQEAWEKERKALQDAVKSAGRGTEDAEDSKDSSLTDANRKLEDSLTPENADSTLGLYQLELANSQQDVKKIRELKAADGQILADMASTITRVAVSPGENTGSGASIVFADDSKPLQFETLLDKDQKKYVNLGAEAVISFGGEFGTKEKVTVDYLTESEVSPGSFTALMNLPEGVGAIGQGGTFTLNTQSDSYNNCIPVDALHQDQNQRYFVYVLGEKDGILGKELSAEKIFVELLDKNDRYAAIDGGAIDSESKVITASTEEFGDGDVVRMKD